MQRDLRRYSSYALYVPQGVRRQASLVEGVKYRKNFINRPLCYVVGVASSGKVRCFLFFFVFVFLGPSEGLSSSPFAVLFAPFPE